MSELPSPSPWPAAEDYLFPVNRDQQLAEIVYMYADRNECEQMLRGLEGMYSNFPFVRHMKDFAMVASKVRSSITPASHGRANDGFYMGALLATHVNLWPIIESDNAKMLLRNSQFTPVPDEEKVAIIGNWLDDDLETYHDYLAEYGSSVQNDTETVAERLYPVDMEDRADFLAGFCFSSQAIGIFV